MKLNYCMECAAPLTKKTDTEYICENGHTYWNNPSGTVAVVLLRDEKILVSKRAREPAKGKYDLPGGFIEYGEEPFAAAVREIKEETGIDLDTSQLSLIGAYGGHYFENEFLVDLIVLVREWQGTPVADDDSEALEWRPLSFLDEPDFSPPYDGLRQKLEDILGSVPVKLA